MVKHRLRLPLYRSFITLSFLYLHPLAMVLAQDELNEALSTPAPALVERVIVDLATAIVDHDATNDAEEIYVGDLCPNEEPTTTQLESPALSPTNPPATGGGAKEPPKEVNCKPVPVRCGKDAPSVCLACRYPRIDGTTKPVQANADDCEKRLRELRDQKLEDPKFLKRMAAALAGVNCNLGKSSGTCKKLCKNPSSGEEELKSAVCALTLNAKAEKGRWYFEWDFAHTNQFGYGKPQLWETRVCLTLYGMCPQECVVLPAKK